MSDEKKASNVRVVRKGADAPTSVPAVPKPSPTYRVVGMQKLAPSLPQVPDRAIIANAFESEDEYQQYYVGQTRDVGAIQPPYDFRTLDRKCQENNTLSPAIEAMVTNIDGTGFSFVKDVDYSDEFETGAFDPQIQKLWDFFKQPWPGESFTTIRKNLRRDYERLGNGYLEFLRNAKDEIIFCKHVDGKMIRLVQLGEPISVETTVNRNGVEYSVKVMRRFRRFVQVVNGINLVYFKEFGCPLDLDKKTGKWANPGERLGWQKRATEIMHFKCLPDAHTPYGVPRWINQLPSVLGSRKAEEFNLEFFDNGGVPPVLLLLQGGALATESRKVLEQRLAGEAFKKNRVVVIEMEPTGGSIDHPSNTKVTVERFGAERQNDALFENYDERCATRVRRSFRLPPIFFGDSEQNSFATAYTSYTTAEAQVFRPERDEFDEIISVKVLPAMGYSEYRMQSRPLSIEDATLKLQGIELGMQGGEFDAANVLDEINKTVGLRLKVGTDSTEPQLVAGARTNANGTKQSNSTKSKPKATPVRSPAVSKNDIDIPELAISLFLAVADMDAPGIAGCVELIRTLTKSELEEFQVAFDAVQSERAIKLIAAE